MAPHPVQRVIEFTFLLHVVPTEVALFSRDSPGKSVRDTETRVVTGGNDSNFSDGISITFWPATLAH